MYIFHCCFLYDFLFCKKSFAFDVVSFAFLLVVVAAAVIVFSQRFLCCFFILYTYLLLFHPKGMLKWNMLRKTVWISISFSLFHSLLLLNCIGKRFYMFRLLVVVFFWCCCWTYLFCFGFFFVLGTKKKTMWQQTNNGTFKFM